MIWISGPKQSVMEQTMSNPSSVGSGPMKLVATLSPHSSGNGKGCNGLAAFVILVFDSQYSQVYTPIQDCVGPVVRIPKCSIGFISSEMA